jgi:ABC-type antimicrobial peptide transport system permease subunit
MQQQISEHVILERLLATLAGVFAIVAMLLTALGLYGVTTYATMARTREIGVRIALGATASAILVLITRQTTTLIALGVTAGFVMTLAGIRSLRSLLFGLEPTDPLVLGCATFAVVTVTAIAAWMPARRATRIDPMSALQ